jgi:signal transduction histidine kinase
MARAEAQAQETMSRQSRFVDAVFLSRRGLALCCAALLILLGANALVFHSNTQTLLDQEHEVAHTQEVLANVNGTLATITAAESAQRGYILTGDSSYLQAYTAAARAVSPDIARLRRLVADNPAQERRAVALGALAREDLAGLEQALALLRTGQRAQAQALGLTDRDKATSNAIHRLTDEMTATEFALLHRRTAAAANAAGTTTATLAAAIAIDAVLLAGILLLILRTLARRAQLADERARLLSQAEQARAVAETAVSVRDEFLSLAAHELKTPITSVVANAQLLDRRGDALAPRDQRLVAAIVAGTDRLRALTEHLLDLSQLERGRLELDLAPLDLTTLAQRAVDEVAPTAPRHTVRLVVERAPLVVRADSLRLEQVVHNLLTNAVKYSPDGGEVTVTAACLDGHARLSVADQGVGIPAEALAHIFDRYYRAANVVSRNYSGLGMGLYMAREVMTGHGGTISVESAEGRGSTFTLDLPLAPDAEGSPP